MFNVHRDHHSDTAKEGEKEKATAVAGPQEIEERKRQEVKVAPVRRCQV